MLANKFKVQYIGIEISNKKNQGEINHSVKNFEPVAARIRTSYFD